MPQPIVQIDDPIQPLNENEIEEILTAAANEEELDRISSALPGGMPIF